MMARSDVEDLNDCTRLLSYLEKAEYTSDYLKYVAHPALQDKVRDMDEQVKNLVEEATELFAEATKLVKPIEDREERRDG